MRSTFLFLKQPEWAITIGLLVVYLVVAILFALRNYLQLDASFLLGCALFPYLIILRKKGEYSYRYGVVAGLCWILSVWAPVKTLQYFTLAFGFLFLLEVRLGRLNALPFGSLIVISPIFRYATEVFTFPIRLQLSQWTGQLIGLLYKQVAVQGNIILLKGNEFAVDKACVGLQLLTISSLLTLFFLAYYERNTEKRIPRGVTGVILCVLFGLVVLSNLIRMIVLVMFHILPDNPLHYWTGIICLIVYVLLPVVLLIRWSYQCWGKRVIAEAEMEKPASHWSFAGPALLLTALVSLSFTRSEGVSVLSPSHSQLAGYQKTVLEESIWKFEKPEALVYVKPIPAFYSTEHSPLICWRGSGYQFSSVREHSFGNTKIYTGRLKKGKDSLQTAWWFSDGKHHTHSQWDWRWQMLFKGQQYSLVNVTAESELVLWQEVERIWMAGK